ncbi:hypothetical protein CYMTET_7954 [Cymbomonas tetramitiformis]|uniref:Uncharacterized protein n=1 Tax=Cymbomonas tetramitiformis TaxID=36881 RepID=A0AAE0GVX4_9CHLO|nr:hypothetical protein CYMTET_7954 [Cymbomonas tetramitiformis]
MGQYASSCNSIDAHTVAYRSTDNQPQCNTHRFTDELTNWFTDGQPQCSHRSLDSQSQCAPTGSHGRAHFTGSLTAASAVTPTARVSTTRFADGFTNWFTDSQPKRISHRGSSPDNQSQCAANRFADELTNWFTDSEPERIPHDPLPAPVRHRLYPD